MSDHACPYLDDTDFPCLTLRCKHHLWLELAINSTVPSDQDLVDHVVELASMVKPPHFCVLMASKAIRLHEDDVEVGKVLGLTGPQVHLAVQSALRKLKPHVAVLQGLSTLAPQPDKTPPTHRTCGYPSCGVQLRKGNQKGVCAWHIRHRLLDAPICEVVGCETTITQTGKCLPCAMKRVKEQGFGVRGARGRWS